MSISMWIVCASNKHVSNVSIALRKGKGGQFKKISSNLLNDEEQFKQFLQFDDGYRFLKPIRGTPSFWQGVQHDLLAFVRQLGVLTWFCSFSSADLRWKNLLSSILKQEGGQIDVNFHGVILLLQRALQYLKRTNVHYKDVEFNEAWLNGFCREQESVAEQDSIAVDGND